jgi:ribonuclease R
MFGTIELHGSRLMVKRDGEDVASPCYNTTFIPYDRVRIEGDLLVLHERRAQSAVGVVSAYIEGGILVYLAHIGPACPSRLYVYGLTAPIGYRLLLWLAADGSVQVKTYATLGYSADPAEDSKCLLDMYRLHDERPALPMTAGPHRYTRDGVVDETALETFTIDPATSKDFDDALSVDVANRTIYVHIVDIAAAALSEEEQKRMRERCQTLYLANEATEHLLDEATASHTLSLVVGEPRNTVTVKAVLNVDNTIASYEVYRSTIIVKRRYTYDEVDALLKTETDAGPALYYLKDIAEYRSAVVKYNINLPSVFFQVDPETGLTTNVETHATTTPAHQLVATAMIMANMLVSKHLHDQGVALPNRFHESLRGYDVSKAPVTGDAVADSFILLKRYARACYKVDERGHFGLGVEHYVHFTSPMRRYADVIVHKLLAGYSVETAALEAEVEWINKRSYTCRVIQDLYEHWKVINWLKRIPGNHEVLITNVSKAGIQWFMPSLSLNGFTHISHLAPKQFYDFNLPTPTLTGRTTGTVFAVGGKKRGVLLSVDPVMAQPLLALSD